MWTRGLAPWYRAHGRHHLPWRRTRDPWAVLVSEVMLQQTQVGRVIPHWERFLQRWPAPQACAASPLEDVLRAWQGLGYPRRARALWQTAGAVSERGWPRDEAGLRALPGVGVYTSRALLTLAFGARAAPPLDVNIARVAARAAFGAAAHDVPRAVLERAIDAARPRTLDRRHYTFALFDAGALHCRALPRCDGCPLAPGCAHRRGATPPAGARGPREPRAPAYAGSMRQLRGAVLAASLAAPQPLTAAAARAAVAHLPQAGEPGAVERALTSLRADGLLAAPPAE